MLDLNIKQPEKLILGDKESLLYKYISVVKPYLIKLKRYMNYREELEDIYKIILLIKNTTFKNQLKKRQKFLENYILEQEKTICKKYKMELIEFLQEGQDLPF